MCDNYLENFYKIIQVFQKFNFEIYLYFKIRENVTFNTINLQICMEFEKINHQI